MSKGAYTWMYHDDESRRFIYSLRMLRQSKGLRTQDVAEQLGIDCCSYRRYERGTSSPSLENLIKTAEILGYDLSDSFNYKYYYGKISRTQIRRELKRYAMSHEELSRLTGYSKVHIRNTLYDCGEGSMMCLGAIYDVIKQEQEAEEFRITHCVTRDRRQKKCRRH